MAAARDLRRGMRLFIVAAILQTLGFDSAGWGAFLPATVSPQQEVFYLTLHTLILPLVSAALVLGAVASGAAGFLLLYRARDTLGPGDRPWMEYARYAFVAAFVVGAVLFVGGVAAGVGLLPYAYGIPNQLNLFLVLAMGLILYWTIRAVALPSLRPLALSALLAGIAGAAASSLSALTYNPTAAVLGSVLDLVSIVLWLLVFVEAYVQLTGPRGLAWGARPVP